jgi:hypothetical protein
MMVINFCIPFDSIPAILAIITDSSIVIISNIFATLGLRSLFLLASMHCSIRKGYVYTFSRGFGRIHSSNILFCCESH